MEKRGFLLYPNYKEQIDLLNVEQKAELLDAIFDYQNGIEVGNLTDITEMAFSFIKSQFERDAEAWENTRKKRSEAGKMGGAPKGNGNAIKDNEKQAKQANGCFDNEKQAKQAKQAVNVNVNVNENVNENVNSMTVSKDTVRQTETVRRVVEAWNELEDYGIKPVSKLSYDSKRYKSLVARLKEYNEADVIKAIDMIKHSDFLTGRNKQGWTITFDWFVLPNNFPKVLEGNYLNRGDPIRTGNITQIDEFLEMARNGI